MCRIKYSEKRGSHFFEICNSAACLSVHQFITQTQLQTSELQTRVVTDLKNQYGGSERMSELNNQSISANKQITTGVRFLEADHYQ